MPHIEYEPGHAPPEPFLRTHTRTVVHSIDEAVAVAVRLSFEQTQARERAEAELRAPAEPKATEGAVP